MNKLTLLFLAVPMLTLSACSNEVEVPENAEVVVENANYAWNTAFNQADSQALAALYANDATVSAGDGNVLRGREEIETLFAGFFENGLHNHTIVPTEIYAVGDQLVQLAEWSANVNDEAGEVMTFQGILMTVLQKNADDEWHVVSHVWNMAQ